MQTKFDVNRKFKSCVNVWPLQNLLRDVLAKGWHYHHLQSRHSHLELVNFTMPLVLYYALLIASTLCNFETL